jgi:RNA polymerase sigma factor (sigma-70 family)
MSTNTALQLAMANERNNKITATIKSMSKKLFGFIKSRVSNIEDAEDILQDVFYSFAGADDIEEASSWLYAVARNKITDSYRKQKLPLADDIFSSSEEEEDSMNWKEILLPSPDNAETDHMRNLFWEELQVALNELPKEQRDAFVENEINDVSFKELSEQTGVSVATLISRKRYAVLHLRERLQTLKDELLNY